jgi:hypothetical protein
MSDIHSPMLQLGTFFALACALATNVAMLCKHRGAVAAPAVRLSKPLRSVASLFRSRWWAIGFGIAIGAWALHVVALAMAPISVVETTISGGLVLLAWLAERWFGVRIGLREWIGLGLCAAGLALLAATSVGTVHNSASYSTAAMISFEAGAVGTGALLLVHGTSGSVRRSSGPLLAIAAGLLLGVANVSVKALTGTVPGDLLSIISPWTLAALVAGVGAFFGLARGLQTGEAIPVIAITSVAANCASVAGGILVFGDPVGNDPLDVVARCIAFVAVIVAVALMPAPRRTADAPA